MITPNHLNRCVALLLILISVTISVAQRPGQRRDDDISIPPDLIRRIEERRQRELQVMLSESLPNRITTLGEDYIAFVTPTLGNVAPPSPVPGYPTEAVLASDIRAERRAIYSAAAANLRAQYTHVGNLRDLEKQLHTLESQAIEVQRLLSELTTYAEQRATLDSIRIPNASARRELVALLDDAPSDPNEPTNNFEGHTWLHPGWKAISQRWDEIQGVVENYDFVKLEPRSQPEASALGETLQKRNELIASNVHEVNGIPTQTRSIEAWVRERLIQAVRNSKPTQLARLREKFVLLEQSSRSTLVRFTPVRRQRQELLLNRVANLNNLLRREEAFLRDEKADLDSQSRRLSPITEALDAERANSEEVFNQLTETADRLSNEQAQIEQRESDLEQGSRNLEVLEGNLDRLRKEIEESVFRCPTGNVSLEQCTDSGAKRAFIERMRQKQNELLELRRKITNVRTSLRQNWNSLRERRASLLHQERELRVRRLAWFQGSRRLFGELRQHGKVLLELRNALALNDEETRANMADLQTLREIIFQDEPVAR